MGKVTDILNEKIVPLITDLGYEVVEAEYIKKGMDMHMTFFIHKAGGISLDDCELVTKAIDAPLDEVNPTCDAPYILNVSSPGLDRPIKTEKDFLRNMGEEVEIKLYSQIDKKKMFHGILKEKTDAEIVLIIDGNEMRFPADKVSLVRPYVDFK